MTNSVKTQITFTAEQMKRLKQESKKSGNAVAAIVRVAVADYFERLKSQGAANVR